MSVRVKIPTPLRKLAGGSDAVEVDGKTVAEVLDALEAKHPGFKAKLLDDAGQLRRFVNVYYGDEDVRFLDGLATEVADGAELSIVPAIAGGR
ncbi:MAG: MoaD/ThiS family protein [Deltaproteobacteria bacterium]|nr:MAG: MoaD/ThiS family protein [Deltaproteobacteria bacterium]